MLLRMGGVLLLSAGLAADDPKAAQVLTQARDAIGGGARLAKVQGLSAVGGSMQMWRDGHVGELKIDLQLPDKLLRTDSSQGRGSDATFVMLRGLNGTTLLRNSKIINAVPGNRMSKPPIIGGTDTAALKQAGDELTRFALALLLTPPPAAQIVFTYAGEAESPDGRADVLDVKGASGFAARLFLDKGSHRPLMLTYRDFDPRFIVPPKPGDPPGAASSNTTSLVELTWFFEEYRAVSGIQLPHRISRSIDGADDEEWTFKTFTLNPAFKADAFSDK
jgi:hypothetical protein